MSACSDVGQMPMADTRPVGYSRPMTKRKWLELGTIGMGLALIIGLFTFVAYEDPSPIGFVLAFIAFMFGMWAFYRARIAD